MCETEKPAVSVDGRMSGNSHGRVLPLDDATDPAEPRSMTLADLLALFAGLSVALASVPENVRPLLAPANWASDRLPDTSSVFLMVYLLGSWIVVALGAATTAAIVGRVVRYRRMPLAGEWLVIALILVSPLISSERLILAPLEFLDRSLLAAYPLRRWMGDPTSGGAFAITLGWLGGLVLAMWAARGRHPLVKFALIAGILILYLAIPAQFAGWRVGNDFHIPMWNDTSWREFEVLSVTVPTFTPHWLPAAVAMGFVVSRANLRQIKHWRWTEWAGPVMLLGILLLHVWLFWDPDDRVRQWVWMLAILPIGMPLAWPLGWCWNRWWSADTNRSP